MDTPLVTPADAPRTALGVLGVLARVLIAVSVLALVAAALLLFTSHPKLSPGGPSGPAKAYAVRVAAMASAQSLPPSLQVGGDPLSMLEPSRLAVYGGLGLVLGLVAVFGLRWQRRGSPRMKGVRVTGAAAKDPEVNDESV